MRNWVIGTLLVIGGGILAIILVILGFSKPLAVGLGITISTIGFVVQMYTAFHMKNSFERKRTAAAQRHEQLMAEVLNLPPEEAVRRLLENCLPVN